MSGYAVAVLVVTPQGIPLVRDPKKPAPVFWKLPGGRSEEGETAQRCAVRELAEEVGISLLEDDIRVVHSEERGTHTLVIFRMDLRTLPQLRRKGNEGEEVEVFNPQEILAMDNFFPSHRKVVGRVLVEL